MVRLIDNAGSTGCCELRGRPFMELEILRSVLRVSFQDQPSVGVPMLKDLFQITEQVLSQGRIKTFRAHPLNQDNLLSHVLFAFSDVPVNLSKYFASVQCLRHGDLPSWGQCQIAADYAPDRTRGPRESHPSRCPSAPHRWRCKRIIRQTWLDFL
jgi:hypothetical protein